MAISLAVVGQCDAILMIGESRGATKEKELVLSQGKPVYWSIEEIPTGF
jgi:hypothetical protein